MLTSVRRLWVARRSVTTDNQDATTDEPNSLHGTMKSRMVAEHMVSKIPIHILKSCLSHDVNESAAYFEEHPELKFDGYNSKRAVVSAFKNPDTWLQSLCIKGSNKELCDGVNDVEKIAMLVLQILTQMIQDSGVAQPQIADCPVPRGGAGDRARGRPRRGNLAVR